MKTQTPPQLRFAAPRIAIEYPREGEVISSSRYTFCIDGSARVEIAIDGDDWRSCRRSDGYWWFDWSGYESGRHQAIVRSAPLAGQDSATRTCRFLVELPGDGPR